MFYKWCTSCLCIICPTLVTKAQSLNFIRSHYYYNMNSGQGVLGGISVLLVVSAAHYRLRKWLLIVIVNSVAYIWAFIQIHSDYLLCTKRLACRFTCTMFLLDILTASVRALGWSKKKTKTQNPVMDWFHLLFFLHGVHFLCSLDFGHNFKSKAGQYA